MNRSMTRNIMLRLALVVSPTMSMASEVSRVFFETQPDGLQITINGKPFARYVFATEATPRPFFEHLHAPDGTQVTRNHPPVEGTDLGDHPTYHPGLWLAFGDINGADFWRNRDRIRHVEFVEQPRGGTDRGTFAVRNRYESNGKVIGEEICRLSILARPSGSLLIWDSTFQAKGGDLVFGDQEEMGLGVRVATPLAVVKGGRIIDSERRVNEAQVWGKQADWCTYAGEIDGQRVGLLMMPDPGNFRRSWFHARDYGLLVANPFGANAFTGGPKSRVVVKDGATLRLRFGLLAYHIKPRENPDFDGAYQDFRKQIEGDGWLSLFDGKSLDGWTVLGGKARYEAKDGMIVGTTVEGSPNTFLCRGDYEDFELELEVQCDPPLNSGIQVRSHVYIQDTPQKSNPKRVRPAGTVFGPQCEIAEAEKGVSGNFWDEARRTRWLDDFAEKPEARKAFRNGEWNLYRIVVQGDHYRSWVNGVPCAEFRDDLDRSGLIGLQVHAIKAGSGPYKVRWRNIQIRELKPGETVN